MGVGDKGKTKDQLIKEVAQLNQRIFDLEKSEAVPKVTEDITERKQLEDALQTANYKLHAMVYEYCLRYQRISLFNQMAEKLQPCTSPEETYPIISHFAQRLFPVETGEIFILDPSGNTATVVASWGSKQAREIFFNPKDCRALQRNEIHMTDRLHSVACSCHLTSMMGKSSLCIPVSAHGETFGLLHLQKQISYDECSAKPAYDDEPAEEINRELQQLAATVADYIAMALVNIRLRDSLQQQAVRDPLTGLFNRRYMEETLNREICRAGRHGVPLGIIMVDIDHFRRFNNTFGHDAGDTVLQVLGKFLESHIRGEDVACRYGGEEFTLILPNSSLENTRKRADELRHKAGNLEIRHAGGLLGNVTLSLGVATFPDHGSTGELVLLAADTALYMAKRRGRNRVATASFSKHEITKASQTAAFNRSSVFCDRDAARL